MQSIVWNQQAMTITPMENFEQTTYIQVYILGNKHVPEWIIRVLYQELKEKSQRFLCGLCPENKRTPNN